MIEQVGSVSRVPTHASPSRPPQQTAQERQQVINDQFLGQMRNLGDRMTATQANDST